MAFQIHTKKFALYGLINVMYYTDIKHYKVKMPHSKTGKLHSGLSVTEPHLNLKFNENQRSDKVCQFFCIFFTMYDHSLFLRKKKSSSIKTSWLPLDQSFPVSSTSSQRKVINATFSCAK